MVTEQFSIKNPILYNFELPIQCCVSCNELTNNVITELELTNSIDEKEQPIYNNVFNPTNKASETILPIISKSFTTDVDFLKQTQTLIKSLKNDEINTIKNKHDFNDSKINAIINAIEEIKNDTGFYEKYSYVDLSFAKDLFNNNSFLLEIMSLYNIFTPIMTLIVPIFSLIIPIIIIKIQCVKLDFNNYFEILKKIISGNSVYKAITEFNHLNTGAGQKIYLFLSASIYVFSIYQSIIHCVRFYANIQKINTILFQLKKYLEYTTDIVSYYISKTNKLTKYNNFNHMLLANKSSLALIYEMLNKVNNTLSLSKINELGDLMYVFYQLYDNKEYLAQLSYSFGFNGYFDMLVNINGHVTNNKLTKASYGKKTHKPTFKKMYYPKYINDELTEIKKNDCNLTKNVIISGPNASGKTTTLKSALINVLLAQQIGYGCFDELKLTPYDYFHCYLNIPDTSGRDSLFQAEARRCSEIISTVEDEKDKRHFCIFDELYSGTNPDEAATSAYAFIKYISKKKNVCFMLTTHYINVCNKLMNNKRVENNYMDVLTNGSDFTYTYLMKKGISNVKGGIKVLRELNYPKEMLLDI